jgi:hypothetical protein
MYRMLGQSKIPVSKVTWFSVAGSQGSRVSCTCDKLQRLGMKLSATTATIRLTNRKSLMEIAVALLVNVLEIIGLRLRM